MSFSLFLVLFICFLVVSITPCSAIMITSGDGLKSPHTEPKTTGNDSLTLINHDFDELDSVTSSLGQNVTYVKKRFGDYNWKFWKWASIPNDIENMLSIINDVINKGNNIMHRLEGHASGVEMFLEDFQLIF